MVTKQSAMSPGLIRFIAMHGSGANHFSSAQAAFVEQFFAFNSHSFFHPYPVSLPSSPPPPPPHPPQVSPTGDVLAVSLVLSGIYEDDRDGGAEFWYTGEGGNNLLGNKLQIADQKLTQGNLALLVRGCGPHVVGHAVLNGRDALQWLCRCLSDAPGVRVRSLHVCV